MTEISTFLTQNNIRYHQNAGITICTVTDPQAGTALAKQLVYEIVDKKTSLYLSGGSLKILYEQLAKEEKVTPGAVGLVDERYGEKFHLNSNEVMIKHTGFLRYLQVLDIPFYPILQGVGREETAEAYDNRVRELNSTFPKSVAILGIGPDGHTSSVAPNRKDFKNPMFDQSQKHLFVSEFNDPKSAYGERVGMTFLGLSMLDVLIVVVFGHGKKEALNAMFDPPANGRSEEDIPARFFKRPEIAKKTLLITDQTV